MAIMSFDGALARWEDPVSPTVRTAILPSRSSMFSTSSDDGWDLVYEATQNQSGNGSKHAPETTTPSRPSSRASTLRPSSASPSYTHANPFIDSTASHSLTHSCSTDHFAACARCKPVHTPRIERTLAPFDSYTPFHDDNHDNHNRIYVNSRDSGLSKSTTASRLLQQWGTFRT